MGPTDAGLIPLVFCQTAGCTAALVPRSDCCPVGHPPQSIGLHAQSQGYCRSQRLQEYGSTGDCGQVMEITREYVEQTIIYQILHEQGFPRAMAASNQVG